MHAYAHELNVAKCCPVAQLSRRFIIFELSLKRYSSSALFRVKSRVVDYLKTFIRHDTVYYIYLNQFMVSMAAEKVQQTQAGDML